MRTQINEQLSPGRPRAGVGAAAATATLSPFMRTIVGKNASALVRPGGPAQPIMMPAPGPTSPPPPPPPAKQVVLNINSFANTFRSVFRTGTGLMVAGYSAQINVQGQQAWQDTYGWAQTPAGSPGIPWSPSVRQNLASCSKLLTSMCMARMCQQYNLNPFTTTMSQFLPGYWTKGANVDKITLAQLLTHTSGFPNQDAEIGNMKAMVAQGVGLGPQPRVYCNAAFGLMRFIISNVMGGVTDQAVAAINGGASAASDSLWDYLAISAYEYCMKTYVFTPSGVSGVSTVHGPSDALAYNVSASWNPSNTVPLAGMSTKNTPGWLSASGYNDGDMGWTVGASGWHLSVNEVLKCMSTFRRTSAIVTPYWSQVFITNGFALDLVQQVEPAQFSNPSTGQGYMYAKGGYNGDSGNGSGLRGEQSAAYFLPNDMELVVLCNSIATPAANSGWIAQSDGTGVSVMDVTTRIYTGALEPALTQVPVAIGTRTAAAPPVVAPAPRIALAGAGSINPQLEPQRPRRPGLGASAVTLAGGQTATVTAAPGAIVSVTVQAGGAPVAQSYTSGVKGYVPFSCPDPCQFILDGNPGEITFSWGSGVFAQSATLKIASPPPIKHTPPVRIEVPGPPSSTAGATSTGTKVAVGTAAVAGAGTLTLLLVSAATGWSLSKVLDTAWDKIRGK